MKYFTLLSAFLTVLCAITAEADAATSSIMIDAKSGRVLYEENADIRRYPASLTKLMTLYLTFNALENGTLKLDDHLKISRTAANRSPSRLGLIAGKTIDVRTAILATIVKSANDCATVLGEALAKDERSFAALMTQTAHQLGMKNTTFKNASGLPHSEQKSTARDMAVLAAALYHHYPQYYSWFSIDNFDYEGKTYTGHNTLLKDFAGADGLKTGYTAASGYNIVTSAKRGNHRVIAVTMGHEQVKDRDQKAAAMMDKGLEFAESKPTVKLKTLTAEINKQLPQARIKKYAANPYISDKPAKSKGFWAVQAGAYGDYKKAHDQAEKIRRRLAGKFAGKGVHVDKFSKNGRPMYRAQVTGFQKNDAQKACRLLQNQGQSCLITAFNPDSSYAQK